MKLGLVRDQLAGNHDKIHDTEFKRRVEDLVITARAELIRRNINKYNISPNNFIHQINCLETTQVDAAECCSTNLGCKVTRTTKKVPQPIRIRDRQSNFKYVGTIDGKLSFSYSNPEEIDFLLSERFYNNKTSYSYINGYIYIFGGNPLNIRVRAIFGDPRDAENLNDCDNPNTDCIENIEIEEDLIFNIRDMITRELRMGVDIEQEEVKLEDEESTVN